MRVIAGKFRSRTLRSLPGMQIRPTSDRLRETLFDVLSAGDPNALIGSVWIDLFAGTGSVGIEAFSRGAAGVYFVESSRQAADLIRRNLNSLGISQGFEILQRDSSRAIAHLAAKATQPDYIFLDPPYHLKSAYRDTLSSLADSLLAEHALVIAEHDKKFDPGEAFGVLRRSRKLEQGDAALSFYRSKP